MKTILQRFLEPTPFFFQIIRNIGASLALLSIFFMSLQAKGFVLPDWLSSVLNLYTVAGGLIAGLISQLTSVWRNEDGTLNTIKKSQYEARELENLKAKLTVEKSKKIR